MRETAQKLSNCLLLKPGTGENNKTIANQLVKGERANREKSCPGGMFAFEIVFFNIFYWNFSVLKKGERKIVATLRDG